jgi:thiol-disulfide isomerase/thioredoxin
MRRKLPTSLLACCACALPAFAAHESPTVGSQAPDFTARDILTGEKVTLGAAQGKLVFLTFWATWCAPCRKEIPLLANVEKRLGKERAVVYAVNFQEPQNTLAQVKKVVTSAGWQIAVLEDYSGRIASEYAIHSIPHLFIIGTDGKILSVHTGYGEASLDELADDINRALKASGWAVVDAKATPVQ